MPRDSRQQKATGKADSSDCERLIQTLLLDDKVSRIRSVKETRARGLSRLGISTVRDLIYHFPFRYDDFSTIVRIADARLGEKQSILGTVDEVSVKRPRKNLTIIEASVLDGSGVLYASWFNQPWLIRAIKPRTKLLLLGKIEHHFGYKRLNSPLYTVISQAEESGEADDTGVNELAGIKPVHHATSDISAAWMSRLISEALEATGAVLDPLPVQLRIKHQLMSRRFALKAIHFPADWPEQRQAHRRLAYEEVLYLQLQLMRRRRSEVELGAEFSHRITGEVLDRLSNSLPFTLTADQERSIREILNDMAAPEAMNRLLLGDVGSGKTMVAAYALAAAHASGTQAAMMAPTEVLAEQYALSLGPLFAESGISWALLTSTTNRQQRQQLLEDLASGRITVLFGTHALLEPDVKFKQLTVAVIDEQHRFGVAQRQALREKGSGCDLLAMSATPIPRSLALTLYGDMEVSYLRSRPRATTEVVTKLLPRNNKGEAYDAIREALKASQQAYIICPLISFGGQQLSENQVQEEIEPELITEFSSEQDREHIKAAEQEVVFLRNKVFPQARIGLMTSRLSPADKRKVMTDFRLGNIDILVSTTVVEVGVDVPSATVMIIEDADRFGLSQLHQLRGRVGRGTDDAKVFLIADPRSDEAKARLQAMVKTNDGFKLAEYDLSLRKEGDILGSRQHGATALKLINVIRDSDVIQQAHDDARQLLAEDPDFSHPQHYLLARELETIYCGDEE
ncbi:MAG: ATP-dependent DNA helicase RecG [Coriobacteriaceae bacterium]|nr:ATP-dependent DNA helicase RecG [Coriobacteriaceae bacterium]